MLGASGFVGSRLVEKWTLEDSFQVKALVRSPSSLARLARFPLPDWQIVDALDSQSLGESLKGCDALVHTMIGDANQIAKAAEIAVQACQIAGINNLVYLSSASVHGQNPAPGTIESSPLSDTQPNDYNNAKVRAERALGKAPSSLSVTILRPGIVYGPRCQWINGLLSSLGNHSAYLVEGGKGICNHIYVDNLIHAIELSLQQVKGKSGPYYIADDQSLTWAEFYRPFVESFGYTMDDVVSVERVGPPPKSLKDKVARFKGGTASKLILPRMPRKVKDALKSGIERYTAPPGRNGFELPGQFKPRADFEMSELHLCRTRLEMDRAPKLLGYSPIVTSDEAIHRTIEWYREYMLNTLGASA